MTCPFSAVYQELAFATLKLFKNFRGYFKCESFNVSENKDRCLCNLSGYCSQRCGIAGGKREGIGAGGNVALSLSICQQPFNVSLVGCASYRRSEVKDGLCSWLSSDAASNLDKTLRIFDYTKAT